MSGSSQVNVPEKRLTSPEYEDALVEFAKSPPDLVDEAEYRKRRRETTLTRYQRANTLLDEVQGAILSAATQLGQPADRELQLAIQKIDEAVTQITHGSFAYNGKGAASEGIRDVLVIPRSASAP